MGGMETMNNLYIRTIGQAFDNAYIHIEPYEKAEIERDGENYRINTSDSATRYDTVERSPDEKRKVFYIGIDIVQLCIKLDGVGDQLKTDPLTDQSASQIEKDLYVWQEWEL